MKRLWRTGLVVAFAATASARADYPPGYQLVAVPAQGMQTVPYAAPTTGYAPAMPPSAATGVLGEGQSYYIVQQVKSQSNAAQVSPFPPQQMPVLAPDANRGKLPSFLGQVMPPNPPSKAEEQSYYVIRQVKPGASTATAYSAPQPPAATYGIEGSGYKLVPVYAGQASPPQPAPVMAAPAQGQAYILVGQQPASTSQPMVLVPAQSLNTVQPAQTAPQPMPQAPTLEPVPQETASQLARPSAAPQPMPQAPVLQAVQLAPAPQPTPQAPTYILVPAQETSPAPTQPAPTQEEVIMAPMPTPVHSSAVLSDSCVPCCEGSCCYVTDPPDNRFWFQGEYLLWWIKDAQVPPLLTTSPPESLGQLDQPFTTILVGDSISYPEFSGARMTAGYWCDPCRNWRLEASLFVLEQRSERFATGSPGEPLFARPFVNVNTGAEDAKLVANPVIPNRPDIVAQTGFVDISSASHLWGGEINGLLNVCSSCHYRVDLLAGLRYLHLDEDLEIFENSIVPEDSPLLAGSAFVVNDRFGTENQFYGQQVGARFALLHDRWFCDLTGKVALGVTHEVADIDGFTISSSPGTPTKFTPGGLLAQPTNMGHRSREKFSVVPEIGVKVGYQFTCCLRGYVGYNFLYWSNVARPGEQIDRFVNTKQVPTLTGPALPHFSFNGTDFWAHGITAGLEVQY